MKKRKCWINAIGLSIVCMLFVQHSSAQTIKDQKHLEELYAKDVYSINKYFDPNSDTYYYLTRIKHLNPSGDLVKLKTAFAAKPEGETGSEFAARTNALLAFNGSTARAKKSESGQVVKRWPTGIQIIDGVIKQELPRSSYTLGIKEDNTLVSYPPGIEAEAIIKDGTDNAISGFIPLIVDHQAVDESVRKVYRPYKEKHPRQVIAQYDNLDLVFLSCGGRGFDGEGMTIQDLINILEKEGVKFAFMIDGGGSVTVMAEGERVTKKIDKKGTIERARPNFLYVPSGN